MLKTFVGYFTDDNDKPEEAAEVADKAEAEDTFNTDLPIINKSNGSNGSNNSGSTLPPYTPLIPANNLNSSEMTGNTREMQTFRRNVRHRKMSFPVTATPGGIIHPLSNTPFPTSSGLEIPEINRRFRRISNVSDAVSRKLSTTIAGWRTVSETDIVNQSKSLCGQYIRSRLKRTGIFTRKLGLQRLRSMASLPGATSLETVAEIFTHLQAIGIELERMHPKLYTGVCRQVSVTITSEKSVSNVLSSVARELFKTEISWAKIISLYCVAGGLAVDCVRQGHPEYLFGIVETMGLVVENYVASWIAQQGGWTALMLRYQSPNSDKNFFQEIAISVTILMFMIVILLFLIQSVFKFIGST